MVPPIGFANINFRHINKARERAEREEREERERREERGERGRGVSGRGREGKKRESMHHACTTHTGKGWKKAKASATSTVATR